MQKVRVTLPEKAWGTLATKWPANSIYVSNDQFTAGSKNFETQTKGIIRKHQGGPVYNPTPLAAAPKDQFEAVFSDGSRHLLAVSGGTLYYSSGDGIFHSVTAGYTATANMEFALFQNRVYFGNGIDAPQVYDKTASYGGVTYTVPQTKAAGAQAPVSALTATDSGNAGNIVAGNYYYKVTYVYYGAEESNGGPTSTVVNLANSHTINLTAIPTGGYGVTGRSIYRSSDNITFKYITTLSDNTTTTYTDNTAAGGVPIPIDNGIPPTFSLIAQWKGFMFYAGVAGNLSYLYYSNSQLPDLVSATGFILCNPEDPITALVVFNDRVVVFNRRSWGQILGTTPDTFKFYRYPGPVGCVDNRSVQTRVIAGLPTLLWLSERGFYQFDGATVSYISNPIEDLVSFNIQQAAQTSGSNTQSQQSDFQGDTASTAIDLTSSPGTVTTKNPKRLWQTQGDWEGGSAFADIATKANVGVLTCPAAFAPAVSSGTFSSTINNSGNISLTQASDFTGAGNTTVGNDVAPTGYALIATQYTIARAGTVGTVTARATSNIGSNGFAVAIWADNGLGMPGTLLAQGPTYVAPTLPYPANTVITGTLNQAVAAGPLWVGVVVVPGSNDEMGIQNNGIYFTTASGFTMALRRSPRLGSGTTLYSNTQVSAAFTFTQAAVSAAGTWISPISDSGLFGTSQGLTVSLSETGSYPAGCSATTYVEESSAADFSSDVQTLSVNNTNGTNPLGFTATKRYWRIRANLSTTDDRNVPSLGAPTVVYPTTATWTSEEIDTTGDLTAYVALTPTQTTPAGTSITIQAASSTTSGGSYSAFGPLNTIPLRRYVKVQAVLTTNSSDTNVPILTNLLFTYTVVATLVSSIINTNVVPAGWQAFQFSSALNGGTLLVELRSASTSGGIAGASYSTVTNGNIPPTTPLQYAQWRLTFTSNADKVPTVKSVTLNWLITNVASLRLASMFFDKSYYVSGAKYNSSTNNFVLQYDMLGNWRYVDSLALATMGLFFGQPIVGGAAAGTFYQWLNSPTEAGSAVTMDVRTKAFDLGDSTRRKVLRDVYVTFTPTGATYSATYSYDGGNTFNTLVDETGASSFTVPTTGGLFIKRLLPLGADLTGGATILFRLLNSDTNAAEIQEITFDAVMRQQVSASV